VESPDPTRPLGYLPQILRDRATTQPAQIAYEFLRAGGEVEAITYRQLAAAACELAGQLREGSGPVLILQVPGLGFITAIWACLLSGRPAIPTYPPGAGGPDRAGSRLRSVMADARPVEVIADPFSNDLLHAADLALALPTLIAEHDPAAVEPAPTQAIEITSPAAGDVAIVQYTSGSTGQPKGVMLTHGNLIANIQAISDVLELNSSSRSASWLPPYHDMGLIGCILTPVYAGFPIRLMSPLDFLKSPLTWLRQISEIRATVTGGPNFAYDLCVRRARGSGLGDIDLSSWSVAFNGAEPVRPETLQRFAQRFAGNGFRSSAFLPCYGLAEATLIVSGRHRDPASDRPSPGQRRHVSCGPAISGSRIAIVADQRQLADDEEGEIWVSGPCVTAGYWHGGDEELFGELAGSRFLRTGDLGYLHDGELYVTGRRADVLVYRGVNYHAQDIEDAAVLDNPDLRPVAAAFMVDDPDPAIVLVAEWQHASAQLEEVGKQLSARVLASLGLRLDTVVLCRPRSIPRTTSGKVQRRLCRARYLAGEFGTTAVTLQSAGGRSDNLSLATDALGGFIAEVFAEVCEVGNCALDQSLTEIGGDSLRAGEIAAVIDDATTMRLRVEDVLVASTPRRLAAHVLEEWERQGIDTESALHRLAGMDEKARTIR
jgi:acyl-CoA synthetase (AMP-forming)/AMP-acid ligase II